jgi:hypothetical protein
VQQQELITPKRCNGGAKSACYQLRWNKKVVLSEQVDGIVKKYLKSLKKNHSRR